VSTAAGWRLVAVCAALSVSVAAGWAVRPRAAVMVVVGATLAGIACALAARGSRVALVAALAAICCVGGLCRGALAVPGGTTLLDVTRGGPAVLIGAVREGTGSRRSTAQVVVDVDRVVAGDVDRPLHAGVLATLRAGPDLLPGDDVELDVTGLRAPGSVGAESILSREGVDAVAQSPTVTVRAHGGLSPSRLLAIARGHFAATLDGALPEPAAALLDGIVFGIARPLPADLTTALRDSGLAHVLAVSGLKVVLVAGLVAALCGAAAASPRARLAATASAVGGYVLLCGAGPAAVRSAIMAGAGWSLYGSGRAADPLPLLSAVAAAMLVVDPGLSRDVGFQLSVLGTLGIVLLAGRVARRLPGPRLFREPFAMALSAQMATLPVMAGTFGVVSLIGPLANAVAVPLLPALIAIALIGTLLALAVPAIGVLLLQTAGLVALLVAAIARIAASIPAAAIHVAAWPPVLIIGELAALGFAALVWVALRRRRTTTVATLPSTLTPSPPVAHEEMAGARRPPRRIPRPIAISAAGAAALLAGSAVVLAGSRPDGRLHVAVLDVGGAVAVAIQPRDGGHALVDTGTDPQRLLQSLGAVLPPLTRRLDLVVLTGGDRAAVGALPGLTARYDIDRVVAPADGLAGAARAALDHLRRQGAEVDLLSGDGGWTWGGATWHLLSTDGTPASGGALEIADPTGRVLVLGSLAVDAQEQLAAVQDDALSVDLLVAPVSGAVAPALIEAARPRFVAVANGGGRAARSTTAPLLTGPGVRHTADSGTLFYTGSDEGLMAT